MLRLWNCKPVEPDGLGSIAGMPPQQAQSPMATTMPAWAAISATQSFIGRSANMSIRPVPLGPSMTVPSKTKTSIGRAPEAQSRKIFCA